MRIIVRHPDGREYAVTPEALDGYKAQGFDAVGPETRPPETDLERIAWRSPVLPKRRRRKP